MLVSVIMICADGSHKGQGKLSPFAFVLQRCLVTSWSEIQRIWFDSSTLHVNWTEIFNQKWERLDHKPEATFIYGVNCTLNVCLDYSLTCSGIFFLSDTFLYLKLQNNNGRQIQKMINCCEAQHCDVITPVSVREIFVPVPSALI